MRKKIRERCLVSILCVVATAFISGCMAHAQYQYPTADVPTSEPAYLAKVKTAAPEQIVSKASIIMMQEGKPRELQAGSNGFTCLISPDGTPLCADQNALEWMKAIRERTDPPDRLVSSTCWPGILAQPTTIRISGKRACIGYRPARTSWLSGQGLEKWWAIPEPWTSQIPINRSPCSLAYPMSI